MGVDYSRIPPPPPALVGEYEGEVWSVATSSGGVESHSCRYELPSPVMRGSVRGRARQRGDGWEWRLLWHRGNRDTYVVRYGTAATAEDARLDADTAYRRWRRAVCFGSFVP